jgi:two-component system chemotaxis response regulator CheB
MSATVRNFASAASPSPEHSGEKVRILVIDDSVVMRQLITRMLNSEPTFEVMGSARDGRDALAKIRLLCPDLVTLDIEMPELDGIATLREIKRIAPSVRVIMCSSLTERGASVTLDALLAGADDYVTKQHSGEMAASAYDALRSDLLFKIQQLFKPKLTPAAPTRVFNAPPISTVTRPTQIAPLKATGKAEILVIGVSTGGPSALAEIIPMFPANFPLPIAIVQHMPPFFTHLLAERLTRIGKLTVVEATHGMPVSAGHVLIAPGDFHMRLVRQPSRQIVMHLNQEPQENSCRPAVDVLFRSAAEVYGGAVMAVVLTGMGQDGLLGVRSLKAHNASVIVQDAATSVVWGMPRAIADAQLADSVLPLREIVPALLRSL